MNTKITMEIHPPTKEFKYWVVTFPQLSLGTQGETLGKALANAGEALMLWAEGCEELGSLETVLKNVD